MPYIDFCLLDADYVMEGEKPVIRLFGLAKNRENVVALERNFRPYFYVEAKEGKEKEVMEKLKNLAIENDKPLAIEEIRKGILGRQKKLLKVTVTNPRNMPKFREAVRGWQDVRETYEHAMPFCRRYLIDKQLCPMGWVEMEGNKIDCALEADEFFEIKNISMTENRAVNLKALAFDIETVGSGGEESIIMISMASTTGYKKLLAYTKIDRKDIGIAQDEKGLIEAFVSEINHANPQIIAGYNTDGFDFPKLVSRAEKYRIKIRIGRDSKGILFRRKGRSISAQITGRIHLDIYSFVESILSQSLTSEVLTLDRVARELLGIGKEKMKWKDIEQAWKTKKGLEKIGEYCMQDSEITLKLFSHLSPLIFELGRVTGSTPFDVCRMTYSQLVESLLIRAANDRGEISLNRPHAEEIRKRRLTGQYKGAYVHPPEKGIHENIIVLDFQSLYPSIIAAHNISPDSLDCGHKECMQNRAPDEDHYFCRKRKGMVTEILEGIINRRVKAKQAMENSRDAEEKGRLFNQQFALKILANAFYGYYGYAGSRWYSRICAQSITSWGRHYIKKVIGIAESHGLRVLYGDTDSLFLKTDEKEQSMRLVESINASIPEIMELELKDIYKRGIFIASRTGAAAKKKYALLDKNDRLIMRGMETRRRDWSRIAKDTQEMVLYHILRDKSPEKAIRAVRATIDKLKGGDADMDDLVIYTQLTKPIEKYEQMSPHVRAAQKIIQRGGAVGVGSTIAYIITTGAGSISERAEPAEEAKNYDADYYINNQVIPAALRILSNIGVKEEDLTGSGESQFSLEGFWK
ncbi:MAG: ribonuclease H-like domain-containing protein [Candidatus Aenigmarchaeota archaeon]|nr:ribonuclease H-like domain-containing protein [Candidatus Aenigmarchaeota archaeon]